MKNDIVIVRGGGDVATGTIQKLFRVGYRVLVLEIAKPTVIRRTVAVSTCIYEGKYTIEDFTAIKCENSEDILNAWKNNFIPVIVDPKGDYIKKFKPKFVIDAILAKKNLGLNIDKDFYLIGLGPGFEAKKNVDIVIETNRGHNLGRLIFEGKAEPNTGTPGIIGGYAKERVIYSDYEGYIEHIRKIGDLVEQGEVIAKVGNSEIKAKIKGVLRGLIQEKFYVTVGLKIADIDPREKERENCFTISDKARAIGGNVLEAMLILDK